MINCFSISVMMAEFFSTRFQLTAISFRNVVRRRWQPLPSMWVVIEIGRRRFRLMQTML